MNRIDMLAAYVPPVNELGALDGVLETINNDILRNAVPIMAALGAAGVAALSFRSDREASDKPDIHIDE